MFELENTFVSRFNKLLEDKENRVSEAVTSQVSEDYALQVGYIRAIREVREEFSSLYNSVYGEEL